MIPDTDGRMLLLLQCCSRSTAATAPRSPRSSSQSLASRRADSPGRGLRPAYEGPLLQWRGMLSLGVQAGGTAAAAAGHLLRRRRKRVAVVADGGDQRRQRSPFGPPPSGGGGGGGGAPQVSPSPLIRLRETSQSRLGQGPRAERRLRGLGRPWTLRGLGRRCSCPKQPP